MLTRRRTLGYLAELFLEALMVALAEAVVAAAGWLLRRCRRWWRRRSG